MTSLPPRLLQALEVAALTLGGPLVEADQGLIPLHHQDRVKKKKARGERTFNSPKLQLILLMLGVSPDRSNSLMLGVSPYRFNRLMTGVSLQT